MADAKVPVDFNLPRPTRLNQLPFIEAPSHEQFIQNFGSAFPKPQLVKSALGSTAIYDLSPPSDSAKQRVLIIHGANTPALGMWPLAKELQLRNPDAHIVLFDLWGHGLSSTPLQAHTPSLFHSQILQVLSFMKWTSAHLIGYSFGGSTAVSFTNYYPWVSQSVVLLAPAGLLRMEDFDDRMQGFLEDSHGREEDARDYILSWLEGGPLQVPEDWVTRSKRGEVVAEALKYWELQEHSGYAYSVLSMFRDGGVAGCDADFQEFAQSPIRKLVILGASDDICSATQLEKLGFPEVLVIDGAGHSLTRSHPAQTAKLVDGFWNSSAVNEDGETRAP